MNRAGRAAPAAVSPPVVSALVPVLAIALSAVLAVVLLGACSGTPATGSASPPVGPGGAAGGGTPGTRAVGSGSDDGAPPATAGPGTSVVATAADGAADVYSAASGGRVVRHMTRPAPGAPLVFLVLADTGGDRLRVQLPARPGPATGWIERSGATLFSVDWELVVLPAAHQLRVLRAGRVVETDPVGVGRGVTPTPSGRYYITEILQPPDPAGSYGPFAFGLSAYSPTLTEFAGGSGQIGLHGTNDPSGLGHDVSHGCIRVANSVITRLAQQLPLGTPVDIREG